MDSSVIEQIDADTLVIRLAAWKTIALDVRETKRSASACIADALSIPLSELAASVRGLPLQTSLSLVCESGAESLIAASVLWDLGYRELAILKGGLASYDQPGLPVCL